MEDFNTVITSYPEALFKKNTVPGSLTIATNLLTIEST